MPSMMRATSAGARWKAGKDGPPVRSPAKAGAPLPAASAGPPVRARAKRVAHTRATASATVTIVRAGAAGFIPLRCASRCSAQQHSVKPPIPPSPYLHSLYQKLGVHLQTTGMLEERRYWVPHRPVKARKGAIMSRYALQLEGLDQETNDLVRIELTLVTREPERASVHHYEGLTGCQAQVNWGAPARVPDPPAPFAFSAPRGFIPAA